MILQLTNYIDVDTPLGYGKAILIESKDNDYYWTVILDTLAFVTFPQNKIKACRHYSLSSGMTDKDMQEVLKVMNTI